ncbi:hypothetical protein ALC57_05364, partial [Trachymyrmex cornetzi]
ILPYNEILITEKFQVELIIGLKAGRGGGIEVRYRITSTDLRSPVFYEAFQKNAHSCGELMSSIYVISTFVSLYSRIITKMRQTYLLIWSRMWIQVNAATESWRQSKTYLL